MGALDRRGVKTKGNKKSIAASKEFRIKKRRRGAEKDPTQKLVLTPEQEEIEKWVNNSDNPQITEFRGQFRTRSRKEAMIAAMMVSMGIVTQACDMAGIDYKTHYNWLDSDENYGKALADALNRKKDFIEHALMKLIKDGDSAAVRFSNETINKDRGYIKKTEIVSSFNGTQNIKIQIPDNDLPDEPITQPQK